MADYTKSGGITTAKARRKDSAVRDKGLAPGDRAKRGQDEGDAIDVADLVPEARQTRTHRYVMVEHRRRDTGAVIRALDLTAPDAPDQPVRPAVNDYDVPLEYAAVCETHSSPPAHVATAAQARREAKSSHKWCEGCRADQARTPAARSKARRNS